MVGASKILTVSYGTFSCTLEGFDEPFNTMKAIAEYFRDLAADDRYFGAEPPQPDTEMLHRIAEREMSRRVEAKIDAHGITLRPSAAEPLVHAPAAPVAVTPIVAPPATAARSALPGTAFEVPPSADPVSESVAAKLQRIRAAVAQARAAAHPAEDTTAEDEIEDALPAAGPMPEEIPPAALAEDFGFALDISGPLSAEEAGAIAAPHAGADTGAQPDAPAPVAETAPLAEAAMPQAPAPAAEEPVTEETVTEETVAEETATEATVTESEIAESPPREAEAASEAEADFDRQDRMRRRAERRAALAQRQQAEAARLAAPEAGQAAAGAQDPAPPTPEPTDTAPASAEAQAENPAEASAETQAEGVEPPRPMIRARVIKLRRADAAPLLPAATEADTTGTEAPKAATPKAETTDDSADAIAAAVAAQLAAPLATPSFTAPEPETEAEADLLAELAAMADDLPEDDWGSDDWGKPRADAQPETAAQIIAEAEFADDAFADDEFADDDFEDGFEAGAEVAARIAAEAEAEEADAATLDEAAFDAVAFVREAMAPSEAAREAEPGFEPEFEAEFEPEIEPEPEAASLAAPLRLRPAPNPRPLPEGDVSRLLEEADAQMAGSENRRRISAIAHLKAAVAATVAERRATGQPGAVDDTQPYRQDLTQVVRPRRPVPGAEPAQPTTRPERPELRPAPLVLVSEQRVDRAPAEALAQAQAVRPRRISAASLSRDAIEAEVEAFDDDLEAAAAEAPLNPAEATSFAAFAHSRGTQGLAELLEAAAAFTAQIEGRPHFSPPQIMRKVSAMGAAGGFSREDRLRVFGTLLRQGKIAKVKRGQYAITEASRFFAKGA